VDLLTEARRATVTARRIAQVTLLRLTGGLPPGKAPDTDVADVRALAGRIAASDANGSLASSHFVELTADRPPWYDTGIVLAEGEFVTWWRARLPLICRQQPFRCLHSIEKQRQATAGMLYALVRAMSSATCPL
jgi:hypothetical protein